MSVHGIAFTLAATIATVWISWFVSERSGDGPWLGLLLGALVLVGGIAWDLGI